MESKAVDCRHASDTASSRRMPTSKCSDWNQKRAATAPAAHALLLFERRPACQEEVAVEGAYEVSGALEQGAGPGVGADQHCSNSNQEHHASGQHDHSHSVSPRVAKLILHFIGQPILGSFF